jgi:L-asparaginase/Glu-tRNA(Gln) amidotransferase subunit D
MKQKSLGNFCKIQPTAGLKKRCALMKRISLATSGFELVTKRRRECVFLGEMNLVVPWSDDGPQNLLDAVTVVLSGAENPVVLGVTVVCAGQIHSALHMQKVHTYWLDALDSGDAPPVGFIRSGSLILEEKVAESPARQAQTAIKNVADN